MAALLQAQGYDVFVCTDLDEMAARIDTHIGAVLLTEEALAVDLGPLHRVLDAQPTWSDIPFVLLAGRQAGRRETTEAIRRRLPESAINVVLLERPLSSESLISAIASAMRGRQKQFEIRDRMADIDAQNARLSALLDHLPVGVAFVDSTGATVIANPAFRRFQPDGSIPSWSPDGEERWIGYDESGERVRRDRFVSVRALRGETVAGAEFLYHPADGIDIWTRVSGVPLRDSRGGIAGAISVVIDIDEQKRAQEALKLAADRLEGQVADRTAKLEDALDRLRDEVAERERAEAALRQSQKMEAVGQLTGGIAHDFNNMLTGVMGALDIMRLRIAKERYDDLPRYMDAATVSAERAAGLTARLLAFSRRQSLDSQPTDINALVHSLEDLLKRTMSERISVSIDTGRSLPPAIVDANQLENAILNLAINARDAMPDGGTLRIRTSFVEIDEGSAGEDIGAGSYVCVRVGDSGIGMDPATLDKVFEPFFTTKPIGQGTGLGLSMVYGFAKQSDGQVRIVSQVGAGTDVSILLPAAQIDVVGAEAEEAESLREGDGQRVLLVEDDTFVRMLICDVLAELGYTTEEAGEAEEAVRLFQSGRRFDLLISDVGLPGMNGRQFAEVAREHQPELPILFVTGYAESAASRSEFLGPGMAMIAKPFKIEILSAKISEMLC
jgi:signal transduction histidine kinase/DNA-binding response OmpR family regulator